MFIFCNISSENKTDKPLLVNARIPGFFFDDKEKYKPSFLFNLSLTRNKSVAQILEEEFADHLVKVDNNAHMSIKCKLNAKDRTIGLVQIGKSRQPSAEYEKVAQILAKCPKDSFVIIHFVYIKTNSDSNAPPNDTSTVTDSNGSENIVGSTDFPFFENKTQNVIRLNVDIYAQFFDDEEKYKNGSKFPLQLTREKPVAQILEEKFADYRIEVKDAAMIIILCIHPNNTDNYDFLGGVKIGNSRQASDVYEEVKQLLPQCAAENIFAPIFDVYLKKKN